MEIMERLVQIKIIFIIVITLFTTNSITAQHQIDKDITFNTGKKGNYWLNAFISNYRFDNHDLGYCMKASGIIKFEVTPKGKIASISSSGNLPENLIEGIKKRIYLTENYWVFSNNLIKKNKNIIFYYPIYFSIDLKDKCDSSPHESSELLQILVNNQKVLHIRDEIYFIEPDFWSAVR